MGKVSTGLSMSLDAFIAGPNDGPERPLGEGGERLFAWNSSGDTEYRLPGTDMVFRVSPQSGEARMYKCTDRSVLPVASIFCRL